MTSFDELIIKIAKLSASSDKYGEWWGHDTDVGNLPENIREVLKKHCLSRKRVREAIKKVLWFKTPNHKEQLLKELGLEE